MRKATTSNGHALDGVAIVGAGRLGTALAGALREHGVPVDGPLGRGERAEADVVLICVPDGEIAAAAAAVGRCSFVGHTSGATPLDVLAGLPGEAFGFHPLQTFAGGEDAGSFVGVGCAIAGSDAALSVARDIADRLAMRPFEISDSGRAAYHAAASVASNFLLTLQHAAEELAGGAGLDRDEARALLAPLVRSTVENWAARGPADALTGPVARGDDATVDRQRAAVAETAPHLLALFDELVERTRDLAGSRQAVMA